MYGRGTASVAEQIGTSMEEAQELVDKFFAGFPTVKDWIANTQKEAHERGYVEDVAGRRRRLPDIQLPRYTVSLKNEDLYKGVANFNPLLGTENSFSKEDHPLVAKYKKALANIRGKKDYNTLKAQADAEGVEIKDNTGFIAQAERQCVNARVQGGAGTITKIAMINAAKDPILKSYDFKMLICVHDEIIGECKKEFAKQAGERLSQVMIESAATVCSVPMKCDTYQISRWYEDDFSDLIHEKYAKLIGDGEDILLVQNKFFKEYPMIKPDRLKEMMSGTYECNKYSDI